MDGPPVQQREHAQGGVIAQGHRYPEELLFQVRGQAPVDKPSAVERERTRVNYHIPPGNALRTHGEKLEGEGPQAHGPGENVRLQAVGHLQTRNRGDLTACERLEALFESAALESGV